MEAPAQLDFTFDSQLGSRSWFALYTCTRYENKVATELSRRGVQNYLPTFSSWRKWSDRRVKLELPLFPSYIFVQIAPWEKLRVVTVPGVVRIVSSSAGPTPIPDVEIDGIRRSLSCDVNAQPYNGGLQRGTHVRVVNGPLAGCQGWVLRSKSGMRLVLTIESIARSIILETSAADVEAIRGCPLKKSPYSVSNLRSQVDRAS